MDEFLKSLLQPTQLIWKKLQTWFEIFVLHIPNLVLAVLILSLWLITKKYVIGFFKKALKHSNLTIPLKSLLFTLVGFLYFCIMAIFALTVVGLDKAVISLLAGLGVVGIALGFAFQDLAANFISGVLIAMRSPFKIGDLIQIDDKIGNVDKILLRETVLEGFEGQKIYIPNKDFTKMHFLNFSEKGQRRVSFEVGVAYDSNLEQAQSVIANSLEDLDFVSADYKPAVYLDSFGGSSINIKIIFWIKYPNKNYLKVKSEAIKAVKICLDKANISIPFPIRTLKFQGEKISLATSREIDK